MNLSCAHDRHVDFMGLYLLHIDGLCQLLLGYITLSRSA
jgi:hypothetical protein